MPYAGRRLSAHFRFGVQDGKGEAMKRRDFLSFAGGTAAFGSVASLKASADAAPGGRKLKMHVGTQQGPTTPEMLQYFKRHGVDHICGYPPDPGPRGYWTVEDLEQTRDLCAKHGIALDMVALPFLTSSHIDREPRGAIMLGKSPERDRDIEHINIMTAHCAKAGIPAFKYNMSLLGVLRIAATPGRGGSRYSTWKLEQAKADPALTRAGRVTADVAWERITYFLDRVIPVCNEYKIRALCHPHDPGVPPEGFQGIVRVLGTVEGMKRFVAIQESPFHGLNLCLGTTAEMLADPNREIHDVIRYFGTRKKIFNIHFRNIRGRRDDFQETYLDDGDMDMYQVLRTLAEVDYPYMLMPDHVPNHPDDPRGMQAFAYTYGYIKGLLRALGG
jgi:mannonate dehydratase